MIRRNPKSRRPRGLSAVEAAAVYPIATTLLMGTILVALGIFRYHQVQSLAREGARYASVNGPAYAAATGNAQASTTSVLSHLDTMAVGLSGLSCTSVSYSATTLPCTVSVTLSYTWKPGGFFSSMTWTPTSTMPVTY
jgi:hypothetical protein